MPLPYKVKDLETVPESARELYEKKGDEFVLQVEGVEAAEALLEKRQPKVVWDGETPKGVFPDEVHGDQPIAGYVESWAKGDDAKKFLPVPTKPGGGAPGTEGKGGAPGGKNWAEMTPDEKVAYTGEKYGAGAETGATA